MHGLTNPKFINDVFLIFPTNLSETFHILRWIQRHIIVDVNTSSCKVLVILVIFQSNSNFVDRFSKKNKLEFCRQIFEKEQTRILSTDFRKRTNSNFVDRFSKKNKLEFCRQIFEKEPYIKFNKNPSSGNLVFFFACGRTGRRKDMTKLRGAFHNYAKAPKNGGGRAIIDPRTTDVFDSLCSVSVQQTL